MFASQLTEPDQTNAKVSMISALKDSYDLGRRVCNQGKTQRLIVGVLQGRFSDVDIELNPDMQLTTNQALQMFFAIERHQEITEFSALLRAAEQFSQEHPLIQKEDFLEQIKRYAEVQGIQSSAS